MSDENAAGGTDPDCAGILRRLGYREVVPIGRGVEGAAYSVGGGRVAKVWFERTEGELRPLMACHAELDRAGLPFATPLITEVDTVDGHAVTVERLLPGRPLSDLLDSGAVPTGTAMDAALSILDALAGTTAGQATADLPVLADRPLWTRGTTWGAALTDALYRKLTRFGPQLRHAVAGYDALVAGVLDRLAELPPYPEAVVHGDLCLPNILVDDGGAVLSLLDWGFLTTRGDPALDAATFAGFFDMYGPLARQRDDELTTRIRSRFGYSVESLMLYRAWYALVGSNAYDPDGRDGHFAWCAATLNRKDLHRVLV